jgi:hypothetical protein
MTLASAAIGSMEMQPYLTRLCEALSNSMIGEDQPVILAAALLKATPATGLAQSPPT